MIVLRDGYSKQCSSTPSCVVGLGMLRLFEGRDTVKNLVEIFPIFAYVDFLCREEPGGAIRRLRYRVGEWLHYFDAFVPSYRRINIIKDHIKKFSYKSYPRRSYHRSRCVEKSIKKGYILLFGERGSNNTRKLLLVYDSLKSAKREVENYRFLRRRSELCPDYSLSSFSVSRVVDSLFHPVGLFGLHNRYNIGFWWCRLFLDFLAGTFRPRYSFHIFFHYEIDPKEQEVRYRR